MHFAFGVVESNHDTEDTFHIFNIFSLIHHKYLESNRRELDCNGGGAFLQIQAFIDISRNVTAIFLS